MNPLRDARDRRAAIADVNRSTVVVAGAGAGKTEVLTGRLLAAVVAEASRLMRLGLARDAHDAARQAMASTVALTFTVKATAQMKERAMSRLLSVSHSTGATDPRTEELKDVLAELVPPATDLPALCGAFADQLDLLQVRTIDSFCAEVVRRHALSLGIRPDFEIADSSEPSAAQFERMLAGGLSDRTRDAMRALARSVSPVKLLEFYRNAAASGETFEQIGQWWEPTHDEWDEAAACVQRIADGLRTLHEGRAALTDTGAAYVADRLEPFSAFAQAVENRLSGWAGLPPEIKKGSLRGKACDAIWPDRGEAIELYAERALPVWNAVAFAPDLRAASAELSEFLDGCRQWRQDVGQLVHADVLRLASQAMWTSPARAVQERARVRALIIDEGQDLNFQQVFLFLLYAADDATAPLGVEAGARFGLADFEHVRVRPGALFVVGDAKQSIYRFRGADPESFLWLGQKIDASGGSRYSLRHNFRSDAGLVRRYNRLFPFLFDGPSDPEYEAMDAGPAEGADEATPRPWLGRTVWFPSDGSVTGDAKPDGGNDDSGEDRTMHAQRIAQADSLVGWIVDLRRTGSIERWGEVLVLSPALSDVELYTSAMRRARLPYVIEGGREFYVQQEVMDVTALLKVLSGQQSGISLLTLLRSPLIGLPDPAVSALLRGGIGQALRDGESSAHARTVELLGAGVEIDPAMLRHAIDAMSILGRQIERRRSAAPELWHDEIERIFAPATAYESWPMSAQHAANVEVVLRASAEAIGRSEAAWLHWVNTEQLNVLTAERASPGLFEEGGDAVRVMSIHKAKGLEERYVAIVDLGRKSGRDSYPALLRDTASGREGIVVSKEVWTPGAVAAHRNSAAGRQSEQNRLAYVALTRARCGVALFGPCAGAPSGSLAARLRACLDAARAEDPTQELAIEELQPSDLDEPSMPEIPPVATARPDPTVWVGRRQRADRIGQEPWLGSYSAQAAAKGERPQSGPAATEAPAGTGAETGILVHAYLQSAEWGSLGAFDANRLARLVTEAQADPSAAADAEALLRDTLPWLARHLAPLTPVGREVPFFIEREGSPWTGTIDLLAEDPAQNLVIVDYKTNRVAAAAVHGHAQDVYGAQATLYIEAIQSVTGRLARMQMLYLRPQVAVDLG